MVNISERYPDLEGTKFPSQVDDFERFIDPTTEMSGLITQYQRYFDNGQIAQADALLEANPALKRVIINADNLNKIRDSNIAVQRFFFEDVQQYLMEIVRFRGDYDFAVKYTKYDVVNYIYNQAVQSYMGIKTEIPIGILPTNTDYFIPITLQGPTGNPGTGLNYRGNYDSITTYNTNDSVRYNNTLWAATQTSVGRTPSETSDYWYVVLTAPSQIINVNANYVSSTDDIYFYEATVFGITAYVNQTIILLQLNKTIAGTTVININSLGNVYLKNIIDGIEVNFEANELGENLKYLFEYNGESFIYIGEPVVKAIKSITPTTLTASLPAASWLPMTPEEIAATDPALTVKQEVSIPNLTATQRVDIVRVPVAYEADGHPSLYPYNLAGVCIICAAEAPTADVDVILSVQEVVTL